MENKNYSMEELAKLVALNDIVEAYGIDSIELFEKDTTFDNGEFWDEVNNWSMDKMLSGIKKQSNEKEGYAHAA